MLLLLYEFYSDPNYFQPVMAVIQGERQYQMVKLTLASGDSIEATAEHPFYIKGKGWNPASSLKVGQALQLHNGTTVVIKEIDTSVGVEKVYNLTVANTHNYFVGGDGVLVHNCPEGDDFWSAYEKALKKSSFSDKPPLKRLHSDETTMVGNKLSYEFWNRQSTKNIIDSLKPGKPESLKVKPNGTAMNGNTRLKVLEDRGVDVNNLPR